MITFSWETNAVIEHLIEHPDEIVPTYKQYKAGNDPFLEQMDMQHKLLFNRIAPITKWLQGRDLNMQQQMLILIVALQHEINTMMSELVEERLLDDSAARAILATSTTD